MQISKIFSNLVWRHLIWSDWFFLYVSGAIPKIGQDFKPIGGSIASKNYPNSNTTATTTTTTITTTTTTPWTLHLGCPDYYYTVYGWKDYQLEKYFESWTACSQHCQDRQDCGHWVWYNEGHFKHFCATMTSYDFIAVSQPGIVAGDRDCAGNMVKKVPMGMVMFSQAVKLNFK